MIKTIEKTIGCKDKKGIARGWVIKYDSKDRIKEIKSLFNPNDYKGSRPIYTDAQILIILKREKTKKI